MNFKMRSLLKMRSLSLEVEGLPREARRMWLKAAMQELETLQQNVDDDAAFRAGVGETVACLASACAVHRTPPLLKEHVRTVVRKFLDRCLPTA